MISLIFDKDTNLAALDEALRAVLDPVVYGGVSQSENKTIVHLLQEPEEAILEVINQIVARHDPAIKTEQQQEEERLGQLREEFTTNPLNSEDFGAASDPLRLLADRVAWLEKEITSR